MAQPAPTYINWELQSEFPPYEYILLKYIFEQWTLSGYMTKGATMQDKAAKIIFKIGYPSGNRPYQVTALRITTTPIKPLQTRGLWLDSSTVKINMKARRIQRPDAEASEASITDPLRDLDKLEKEVERIVRQSRANSIPGIMKLSFGGNNRIEEPGDNFTKTEWESDTAVIMEYTKVDRSP